MDEGIIEGSKDAGNTENEFTCTTKSQLAMSRIRQVQQVV
jgi:hypothetical protein